MKLATHRRNTGDNTQTAEWVTAQTSTPRSWGIISDSTSEMMYVFPDIYSQINIRDWGPFIIPVDPYFPEL
ncbi:hypothetical protein HAX54_008515, partial [Datura stramonium]|nr:hypothetical protein [Datura stramonium]